MIRQHEKRAMPHERFVPILFPGATDQHHRRMRPHAFWMRQRSGKLNGSPGILGITKDTLSDCTWMFPNSNPRSPCTGISNLGTDDSRKRIR